MKPQPRGVPIFKDLDAIAAFDKSVMTEATFNALPFAIWTMSFCRSQDSKGFKAYLEALFDRLDILLLKNPSKYYLEQDADGNIRLTHAGEGAKTETVFVAHMDTVHDDKDPIRQIPLKFSATNGDVMLHAPRNKVLGADDAIGIACALDMFFNGAYPVDVILTVGEECGGTGARSILKERLHWLTKYKRAIEVDRKGTDEIIVKMGVGRTGSEAFGTALAAALGMGHKNSHLGSFTDVGVFAQVIPECVNLAAGYYAQHTESETTNLTYLGRLLTAMRKIDWNALPTARTANDFDRPVYGGYGGNTGFGRGGWGDWSRRDINTFDDYDDFDRPVSRPAHINHVPSPAQGLGGTSANPADYGELIGSEYHRVLGMIRQAEHEITPGVNRRLGIRSSVAAEAEVIRILQKQLNLNPKSALSYEDAYVIARVLPEIVAEFMSNYCFNLHDIVAACLDPDAGADDSEE